MLLTVSQVLVFLSNFYISKFLHLNHNVILTPTISKSPVQYQVHPHSPPPPLNTTTTHQQPQLPTTMEVSAMLLCTSLVIHVRTSMWQEILWLINKSYGRKKLKQPKPQRSHKQALSLINIRLKKIQPQLRATTSNNQATTFSLRHNQPCISKTTVTRTGTATGSMFI